MREKFEDAVERAPSIIFIDNLELIAANRNTLQGDIERRMVGQLISLMNQMEEKESITIIGETDRINEIDPAFRRTGRFEREIEFTLPNKEEHHENLLSITKDLSLGDYVDLNIIAEKTNEYTGADLKGLIKEASSLAIREILTLVDLKKNIPKETLDKLEIKMDHLLAALKSKKVLLYCTNCKITYQKSEIMVYCIKCGEKLTNNK